MRRYKNLEKKDIFTALNKVRNAFLAAKNGDEVDKIIDGLLTQDEKLKLGRRILIASALRSGTTIEDIIQELKVGRNTVIHVSRRLEKYKECFDLLEKRDQKVEQEYKTKRFINTGGSKLVHKKKTYTGFKRKNVNR